MDVSLVQDRLIFIAFEGRRRNYWVNRVLSTAVLGSTVRLVILQVMERTASVKSRRTT